MILLARDTVAYSEHSTEFSYSSRYSSVLRFLHLDGFLSLRIELIRTDKGKCLSLSGPSSGYREQPSTTRTVADTSCRRWWIEARPTIAPLPQPVNPTPTSPRLPLAPCPPQSPFHDSHLSFCNVSRYIPVLFNSSSPFLVLQRSLGCQDGYLSFLLFFCLGRVTCRYRMCV